MLRITFCSVLLFVLFTSSCRKLEHEKIVAEATPYQPKNLYPIERLPTYFNRVVVLPNFHTDPSSQVLSYSDDIFHKELTKVGLFETVLLSENTCLELFGQKRFSSAESLPENFLKTLCVFFFGCWCGLGRVPRGPGKEDGDDRCIFFCLFFFACWCGLGRVAPRAR